MEEIPGLETKGYIPRGISVELPDAFGRVVRAGGRTPLAYVGAGMYGIVLRDARGRAMKVARQAPGELPEFMREHLLEEYEFLGAAEGTTVSGNVARVYAFHPEEIVLEREYVPGSVGSWSDGDRLWRLHRRIEKIMVLERGWTSPEFKEDSYVIRPDGTAVLVDASMARRVGMNLAEWIQDVLEGRRKTMERWHDLAFYLLQERRHKTIPRPILEELLHRLVERDPEIARSFSL